MVAHEQSAKPLQTTRHQHLALGAAMVLVSATALVIKRTTTSPLIVPLALCGLALAVNWVLVFAGRAARSHVRAALASSLFTVTACAAIAFRGAEDVCYRLARLGLDSVQECHHAGHPGEEVSAVLGAVFYVVVLSLLAYVSSLGLGRLGGRASLAMAPAVLFGLLWAAAMTSPEGWWDRSSAVPADAPAPPMSLATPFDAGATALAVESLRVSASVTDGADGGAPDAALVASTPEMEGDDAWNNGQQACPQWPWDFSVAREPVLAHERGGDSERLFACELLGTGAVYRPSPQGPVFLGYYGDDPGEPQDCAELQVHAFDVQDDGTVCIDAEVGGGCDLPIRTHRRLKCWSPPNEHGDRAQIEHVLEAAVERPADNSGEDCERYPDSCGDIDVVPEYRGTFVIARGADGATEVCLYAYERPIVGFMPQLPKSARANRSAAYRAQRGAWMNGPSGEAGCPAEQVVRLRQ